jgi:membrane protein implicated in regulation of membrane protease activity
MRPKISREPRQLTAGAWSGLAVPAVAGAAAQAHYTAPWYLAVLVLGAALVATIMRRRRRRGGPSGRGPSGGS